MNDVSTRIDDHQPGPGYLPGIVLIGETKGCYRRLPLLVGQEGKAEVQLLHYSSVLPRGVGAETEEPHALLEKLGVPHRHDGQLAVTVRSEVAPVEGDQCRAVEMIRQRPIVAGCVLDREVDFHCRGLLARRPHC